MADRGGDLIAAVHQRSEPATAIPLTWPPGAGVRVRSVTVPPDEQLTNQLLTLLERLRWVGFAGFMFIVGSDGVPRLVDFNGRIPMSFHQSIAACPALPDRWARVAADRPAGNALAVETGVRYQWLWGDLRRAVKEGRRGRMADLLSCAAYARGATHGIWSVRDPWPVVRSCQHRVRRLLKRLGLGPRRVSANIS